MTIILEMIFVDKKTKEIWATPNHNENDYLDDYHPSKRKSYKKRVLNKVAKKLMDRYGTNPDIVIVDGIIHIDPTIEQYKGKGTIPTGINAEEYFNQIFNLIKDSFHEVANEMEIEYINTYCRYSIFRSYGIIIVECAA